MAHAVIDYTLPAMHLVCHLVVLESTGFNVTDSAVTQSPPQPQPTFLPEGYVAYSDIGYAYKHHPIELLWDQAKNVCLREGAQLAVIDSVKKAKYLERQAPITFVHAGIIRSWDNSWINVNTQEPIFSLPWMTPNEPSGNGHCVHYWAGLGLRNLSCDNRNFFCQLPILVKPAKTTN